MNILFRFKHNYETICQYDIENLTNYFKSLTILSIYQKDI
jgi:hypothetical protein